jgi:hypothetical protein
MEKLLGASATASGQDCMTFFNSQAQTIRTPLGVLLLSRQIPRMGIFFFFFQESINWRSTPCFKSQIQEMSNIVLFRSLDITSTLNLKVLAKI